MPVSFISDNEGAAPGVARLTVRDWSVTIH